MSASVTVPFVNDALDLPAIYEECRGDFSKAGQLAQARLAHARTQGDPTQLADALLARGVVYFLGGEPLAALSCFEEIEQLVPDDTDRLLLAFSYTVLATQLRFQWFPHGDSSGTLDLQARWDPVATGMQNEQRWNDLFAHSTRLDVQLHASLLWRVLHNVPIGRYVLDGSRDLADKNELERRTQVMLQPLQQFRDQAQAAGEASNLLASLDRFMADLCWRARYQADAQQYLERAQAVYEQAGDLAGIASCWMLLGDWMCAPVSSPLVWNRLMLEGDWNSSLSWVRERAEFDHSTLKLDVAQTAYSEAENSFRAADAVRGLGAVELRWGYLQMLAGAYKRVIEYAERARQHFEAAGDGLYAWLARAHRALALIGAKRREDAATAQAIGEWGKGDGSFSYASGLGLLFVREGRRWLTREGDHERAMACYRLAGVLFQALGATDNAVLPSQTVDNSALSSLT